MLEVNKYSATGEVMGKVQLPETLFNVEANNPDAVLYEVLNMYLANQRQGTSSVKSRAEIIGSSRKLFRQKGTGNARVGNRRTPVRIGGGRAFGPRPRDWYRTIPKKKKRLALKLALTERAKQGQIAIIENLRWDSPSTKTARALIEKISPERGRKLVLFEGSDVALIKSFTNLQNVVTDRADSIFAYEVLNCKKLILTEDALKRIEEVFGS